MLTNPQLLPLYCARDDRFFEALGHSAGENTHQWIVTELLPRWQVTTRGVWLHARPSSSPGPEQGWKIHVSCTAYSARAALKRVAVICGRFATPFKVLADERILRLSQSHIWSRSQSGKVITIYPDGDEQFRSLLGELDEALTGVAPGPRVLSDFQYGTSGCVSYRYGAFRIIAAVRPDGGQTWLLRDGNGDLVEDVRNPWPSSPSWVADPLGEQESPVAAPIVLNDRFEVKSALKFSNFGGVYRALDRTTGDAVVLKEARPAVGLPSWIATGTELLRREHELLAELACTGVTPRPIDFFEEQGHLFLASEYIEHDHHLGSFTAGNNALFTLASGHEADEYYATYHGMLVTLADQLTVLHSRNIVMGDLSWANILVTSTGPRLIDLGGSYRYLSEAAPRMITPGMGWIEPGDGPELDLRAFAYSVTSSGSGERPMEQSCRRVSTPVTPESPWLPGNSGTTTSRADSSRRRSRHSGGATIRHFCKERPVSVSPVSMLGSEPAYGAISPTRSRWDIWSRSATRCPTRSDQSGSPTAAPPVAPGAAAGSARPEHRLGVPRAGVARRRPRAGPPDPLGLLEYAAYDGGGGGEHLPSLLARGLLGVAHRGDRLATPPP